MNTFTQMVRDTIVAIEDATGNHVYIDKPAGMFKEVSCITGEVIRTYPASSVFVVSNGGGYPEIWEYTKQYA